MGLFDTFHGICPNCGKIIECQSKLFDCSMINIRIGMLVETKDLVHDMGSYADIKIRAKYTCDCGCYPIIHISGGRFEGFMCGGCADYIEGAFGCLSESVSHKNNNS